MSRTSADMIDNDSKKLIKENNQMKLLEELEDANVPLDNAEHGTLTNLAKDHILAGDACRHCLKLVARHELHDNAFPIDPTIVNSFVSASDMALQKANELYDMTAGTLEEIKDEYVKKDQPLEERLDEIRDNVIKWMKVAIAAVTPIVAVVIYVASLFS